MTSCILDITCLLRIQIEYDKYPISEKMNIPIKIINTTPFHDNVSKRYKQYNDESTYIRKRYIKKK